MIIVAKTISLFEVNQLAKKRFGHIIKGVVDVEKKLLALDAELHADLEKLLLEGGSEQKALWGINLYPEMDGEDWLEYDSMINLRPNDNNLSRGVDSEEIREKIKHIVDELVSR